MKRTELKRKTLKRTPLGPAPANRTTNAGSPRPRRGQPRRDWTDARAKVEREGRCRKCGSGLRLEAAHIIGRECDKAPPVGYAERWPSNFCLIVWPTRIVPLCGPCHRIQHAHGFDTLPLLTLDEQLQAVADAGGIEQARVRLAPSCYRDERAA